jgi:periplasmic divalent cation tolerance protein
MEIQWVYMTAGSEAEARRLGRELLDARLAACINILGPIHSLYRWKDELQDDQEVALIAKTVTGRLPQLVEKVTAVHSYDCPCVVSLPVSGGNPEFLEWVAGEVA